MSVAHSEAVRNRFYVGIFSYKEMTLKFTSLGDYLIKYWKMSLKENVLDYNAVSFLSELNRR